MICPSILSADFCCLGQQCRTVLDAGAQMLHFDVMDGHFVPNITFGIPVLKSLHKGLPDAFFDVHLMIDHPQRYAGDFAKAGAGLLCFHLESADDPAAVLAAIRDAGCKAGISVRPGTPVQALEPYLPQLDLALVMSVEPGFAGQKFMPQALDKIRWLRHWREEHGGDFWIEVDGGVDTATGPACVEAGADILVAGSAVFAAPDPAAMVRTLAAL